MTRSETSPASFRDPSGFVFTDNGQLFRQVNRGYQPHYDQLIASGLYDCLAERRLLVPHEEVDHPRLRENNAYKILKPRRIPFISYPYEWSFTQLKRAAQLTLAVQKRALQRGMILKDASACNAQFIGCQPIFIDTLSFERYQPGQAWQAYRQFCQHFLAPLALMAYRDVRLGQLSRLHIDGVPLDLAASLLPKRSWLNSGLLMHLRLHAGAQRRYAGASASRAKRRAISKNALLNIMDSLLHSIQKLRWDNGQTDWASYYQGDSYQDAAFASKLAIVEKFIQRAQPKTLWDLGANTGLFSRIASQREIATISIDSDPGAVDANFKQAQRENDTRLHPLLIDLTNPSAATGWANQERDSLLDRRSADCALALALIHHLAISNNLPLPSIADFFAQLAPWLVIEFVPKSDKKAQRLLASREDIFSDYTQAGFERAFGTRYETIDSAPVTDSQRRLYLLRRR